jgi:hypothetical protein
VTTRKQLKALRARKDYERRRNMNSNNVPKHLRRPAKSSLGRQHTYHFYARRLRKVFVMKERER